MQLLYLLCAWKDAKIKCATLSAFGRDNNESVETLDLFLNPPDIKRLIELAYELFVANNIPAAVLNSPQWKAFVLAFSSCDRTNGFITNGLLTPDKYNSVTEALRNSE